MFCSRDGGRLASAVPETGRIAAKTFPKGQKRTDVVVEDRFHKVFVLARHRALWCKFALCNAGNGARRMRNCAGWPRTGRAPAKPRSQVISA